MYYIHNTYIAQHALIAYVISPWFLFVQTILFKQSTLHNVISHLRQ